MKNTSCFETIVKEQHNPCKGYLEFVHVHIRNGNETRSVLFLNAPRRNFLAALTLFLQPKVMVSFATAICIWLHSASSTLKLINKWQSIRTGFLSLLRLHFSVASTFSTVYNRCWYDVFSDYLRSFGDKLFNTLSCWLLFNNEVWKLMLYQNDFTRCRSMQSAQVKISWGRRYKNGILIFASGDHGSPRIWLVISSKPVNFCKLLQLESKISALRQLRAGGHNHQPVAAIMLSAVLSHPTLLSVLSRGPEAKSQNL